MKKFFAIVLTLALISTLLVMPVSAADTTLFKAAESASVFDYSDLSGVSADEFAAANIQTGAGSIVMTASAGTASITKVDDSTFKATTTMSGTVGAAVLDFVPDTVSTNAVKSVMTFKFKPSYVTSTGEKAYCNNPSAPSYIRFLPIGVKSDGSKVYHRATQWNTGTQTATDETATRKEAAFSRGAGSGANNYGEGQFTADADGYYYIKLESYENASGQQFAYSYDMNANGAAKGFHRYDATNANAAATLGHGFRFEYSTSSKDGDCVLSAEIKDVKMYYEYAAIGSIATAGSGAYTYDATENSYRFYNKPAGGASGHLVKLNSNEALSTGYVVMDFSLKKEDVVHNEGSSTYGNAKQISTPGGVQLFTINPASTKVGAFNTAGYYYNAASTFRVNDMNNGNTFVANGDWYDLRIVAVNGEEGGTWDYAVYDKNSTYGLDKPVIIKPTAEKTFTGIAAGWYLDASGGRAAMSTDSTKAQTEYPITFKNFAMYSTDTYSSVGAITHELYSESGSPHLVWTKDGSDNKTAVRWDGTLFVSTTSTAKAIIAVYDGEGKEVAKDEKVLANGIYEFGVTTTAKNDARGAWTVDLSDVAAADLTAVFYFYDGENWVTDPYVEPSEEPDPQPEPIEATFASEVAFGDADGVETLRFYFTPSFTDEIADFGAYIVPFALFDDAGEAVTVKGGKVIESGKTFAADLVGIPEAAYDTSIVAVPFVVSTDNLYTYGTRVETTVNALK